MERPWGVNMIYANGGEKVNQVAPATQAGLYREGQLYFTLWSQQQCETLYINCTSLSQMEQMPWYTVQCTYNILYICLAFALSSTNTRHIPLHLRQP